MEDLEPQTLLNPAKNAAGAGTTARLPSKDSAHSGQPKGQRECGSVSASARLNGKNTRASTKVGGRTSLMSREDTTTRDNDDKKLNATFVDAVAMKEKVRQNLSKPQHSVKDYYKKRGIFQAIARSHWFEYCSLAVVAANAMWIAVDTDLNDSDLLLEAHVVFQLAENLFCLLFFSEWFIRYLAFRRKRDGLKDGWFVFDSFLVWMMVLETWVMTSILIFVGGAGAGAGNASMLRIARLLRLSRMCRMARLLRALPELMIMIRGMVAATRSVFFTLCLLAIVLYVFAIAFTQLTAGTDLGTKYFSTVPASMFNLLIYGTLLDNIGSIAKDIGKSSLVIAVIFFLFVLIAALTVMNMLIGVLCEVVNAVAATEKEEMLVTYVNAKLQRVVSLLDEDAGGTISKKEFLQILDNIDAVRCLQDVGVDVIGLVDVADFIFAGDSYVDEDGIDQEEEVELDFAKFMDVVLQLRGTNNATVKDIVDLRKFVRNTLLEMNKHLVKLSHSFEDHRKTLTGVTLTGPRSHSLKSNTGSSDPSGPAFALQSIANGSCMESKIEALARDGKSVWHAAPDNTSELSPSQRSSEVVPVVVDTGAFLQLVQRPVEDEMAGGLPSPLQPSVPVKFLQPDVDEDMPSDPGGTHDERTDDSHSLELTGEWIPCETHNAHPAKAAPRIDVLTASTMQDHEQSGSDLCRGNGHDRVKVSLALRQASVLRGSVVDTASMQVFDKGVVNSLNSSLT